MPDALTDVIVGVTVVLAAAAIVGVVRWARRTGSAIRDLVDHVLPHYTPAAPGDPDASVPGRLTALEASQAEGRADLLRHMQREEATLAAEADARRARQEALDARLSGLARQVAAVDRKVGDAGPVLLDHDARLRDHDARLATVEEARP